MIRKLLVGLCLFVGTTIAYLSLSGGPPKVHIATIVPWFIVALLASLAAWSPLSLLARLGSLGLLAFVGAGLHLYANTAFFGKMEPSVGGYLAFVVLTVVVLGVFLALTAGLARLSTRRWPAVSGKQRT